MQEQTLQPNSGEPDVSSAEGEEDVQEQQYLDSNSSELDDSELGLDKLSEITGRKFKDLEDFKKHYKELSSFVGKNPKELEEKAKAYDEEKLKAQARLKKAQNNGSSSEEIQVLKDKVEEMELLKDSPEAAKILNTIRDVASSRGVSLKEAYESDFKDLLQSKLEAEKKAQEERNPSIESKSRISSAKASKISSLIADIEKTDSAESKEALVKEFLSE
jgi:hypothetical protein